MWRCAWSGLQNASSVAQLAGVDAFVLITTIVPVAQTARRNKQTIPVSHGRSLQGNERASFS